MGYINIFIANYGKVYIDHSQLKIEGERQQSFPLEDINSIVVENQKIQLSAYTLAKLAENNTAVFLCNEKHLPTAAVLPYNSHSRRLKVLRMQLDLKKPLQKQLWRDIVVAKIQNQAECASLCGQDGEKLRHIAGRVMSGDTTHCEAEAAAAYFKIMFGKFFTRGQENITNGAMNYGYAIIRGLIARSLVAHGLEPNFGLFHASELNEFNLADDFIESFRPVVDLFAAKHLNHDRDGLDSEVKLDLYNLINCDVDVDGEKQPLSYAIEMLVSSYLACLRQGGGKLRLPRLLDLNMHRYE